MGRWLRATPLALLSSACTFRPFTPSVSVEYWRQDTGHLQTLPRPTADQAIARWQLPPDSPWARYQKMTLLSSLGAVEGTLEAPVVTTIPVVQQALQAGAVIGQVGLPTDAMWIADLRGPASVAFGTKVSETAKETVALVLTFHNWPAPVELVPAEETLAALITMQPKSPVDAAAFAKPIFLLDAWRLAFRDITPDETVTDNRYMLTPADLPAPADLAALGIKRVIYLVEDLDDTDTEEDDLQQTLLAYQRSGITIYMVDLAWVAGLGKAPRYEEALASQVLTVRERRTLVDDPGFYARSPGGFGGSHLLPPPFLRHRRFHAIYGFGRGSSGGGWAGGRSGG